MTAPNYKIIRFAEAAKMVGKGRSTLWREIKERRFIPPLSLGSRSNGFIESEIQAMIAALAVGFNDEQITELVKKLLVEREVQAKRLLEAVAA
ncbi:helix-turn-helix transcriptional regulator [Alteromonas macleodii]|uniref:helix-turn-helix transcriptional regulator n=1 Tax=Alteromonas macleodii TaxID=28108 RepID=UPI0019262098|nr:AlpA family phage regulatory protein [Alteromonas macleodii]MBL3809569.1 AlpA family phage regulatory protein [Alteromonas macleodii]MBL3883106.1 AlpA family phage regulatory protein [Alteromonas macleodii]